MSESGNDHPVPARRAESTTQPDPNQLELWRRHLDVEAKRIERDNRRTDVMSRAVEVQAENERRFDEGYIEQQRRAAEHLERRWASRTKMAWTGIIFGMVVFVVMLWMAFAGDDVQRGMAGSVLQILLASATSFGLGYVVRGRSSPGS